MQKTSIRAPLPVGGITTRIHFFKPVDKDFPHSEPLASFSRRTHAVKNCIHRYEQQIITLITAGSSNNSTILASSGSVITRPKLVPSPWLVSEKSIGTRSSIFKDFDSGTERLCFSFPSCNITQNFFTLKYDIERKDSVSQPISFVQSGSRIYRISYLPEYRTLNLSPNPSPV